MIKRITTVLGALVLGVALVASGCSAHAGYDTGYSSGTTYVVYD